MQHGGIGKMNVWANRGPSAAGAAEATALASRALVRELPSLTLQQMATVGARVGTCAHLAAGVVAGRAEEGGGHVEGRTRHVQWRREVCRKIDILVQLATAQERARDFEAALSLREDIRKGALALEPPPPHALQRVGGMGEGSMSGRWGSQEEEEEEEVAELLRGCDAAVERCSARMVEQALSGLTPEVWSRQKLALDIKRLEQERKQEQDERELKRSRELAVIQERGGRVVEFALEGGVRLRIVMEGQEVVKDWDEQVRDMPMNDLMKRRQRRIEADRCYEGARNALEKRPPALEQAKFLFERAREAFADLGVFDMIQPLKFLERNIQRIERCEPLLAYEGLKTPVSGHDEGRLAQNGHKGRAYTDLHLAYLDEDGSRDSRDYDSIIDSLALEGGGQEEQEEVFSIQPMVANRHPVARHAHSDPQQRQSEGLAHLSLPYCLDLHTSISSSSIASVSSSSIAVMGTNPLHAATVGRKGGGGWRGSLSSLLFLSGMVRG